MSRLPYPLADAGSARSRQHMPLPMHSRIPSLRGRGVRSVGLLALTISLVQCASGVEERNVVIRTVSGAARNITRLTQSGDDELIPTVSPDGRHVAFQVMRNGQYDICTFDAVNTASRVQVTDSTANDVDPCWCSDSKTIVFSSNRLGTYSLWKQLASGGGGCTMITRGSDTLDFAPAVSPVAPVVCYHSRGVGATREVAIETGSGSYTVFRNNLPHIWKVNLSGNELTQFGEGAFPAWAPDGKRVAFCSDAGGDWDIWTMNEDGTELTRLGSRPKNQISPCWSPDGQYIAYCSDEGGNYDLWIMRSDGTQQTQITSDPAEEGMPNWGSDGNIYFCSQKAGNWDIWRLTPTSLPQ